MKEIGELFKETREQMGLNSEEVASDLEVTVAQLENLEDGNANAFKDIFFLKELIKKYCKYLNLNIDEVLENFNDFMFDFTSRIPVEEIQEKIKEQNKKEEEKNNKSINSPYSQKKVTNAKLRPIILSISIVAILIVGTILLINIFSNKTINESNEGGFIYELTK